AGHRGRLPVEFSLFGVGFAPWTPIDVLAWSKMTAYTLSLNAGLELLRAQLGERLGAATAARLMPPYEGPVTLPSAAPERAAPAAAAGTAALPGAVTRAAVPGAAAAGPAVQHGAAAARTQPVAAIPETPAARGGAAATRAPALGRRAA